MRTIHNCFLFFPLFFIATRALAQTPLGPGFTYQGDIQQGGTAVDGTVHLRFSLWDGAENGNQIGLGQVIPDIPVLEGIFTVILNASDEFGSEAFNGEARWLQIEVCADPDCQSPTTLSPRQPLTPAPYAKIAGPWSVSGNDVFFNSGKVGIGTPQPEQNLTVRTNSGEYGIGQTDGTHIVSTYVSDTGGWFGTVSNHPLSFYTANGGSSLTITPQGNIGVGTSAPEPGYQFQVLTNAIGSQAVHGDAPMGNGVVGSNARPGHGAVVGINSGNNGVGVYGEANLGTGANGVFGSAAQGTGVRGVGDIRGVVGIGRIGVQAIGREGGDSALLAQAGGGPTAAGFDGMVVIEGDLEVSGMVTKSAGTIKIDHPLDPENKSLSHSSVESSDSMNLYNGNIVLDDQGEAEITLPDWFMAFNKDFRYQLTPIGGPGANLYIAQEIVDGKFRIAGGSSNLKVSWQVTGIRDDPYAKANPLEVVKQKTPKEKGKYLNPEVYGQPKEKGIHYRPGLVEAKVPPHTE